MTARGFQIFCATSTCIRQCELSFLVGVDPRWVDRPLTDEYHWHALREGTARGNVVMYQMRGGTRRIQSLANVSAAH